MSLVGTRPPTLDEWDKYELHHRARLAIKPGITGMWQVRGEAILRISRKLSIPIKMSTFFGNSEHPFPEK